VETVCFSETLVSTCNSTWYHNPEENINIISYVICKYMCMIHLRTKFRMPSSSGSLIITAKLKAKENCCMPAMLLFYLLQELP
jgi:hypothetical protein